MTIGGQYNADRNPSTETPREKQNESSYAPNTVVGNTPVTQLENMGEFLLSQLLGSFKIFIQMMRYPIVLMLVGYTSILIISFTSSGATSIVMQGVSQLCTMPLVGMLPICIPTTKPNAPLSALKFSDIVEIQTRLGESRHIVLGSGGVARGVMNMGFVTSDLRRKIERSNSEYKHTLVPKLSAIEQAASVASDQLEDLQTNVSGVVDKFSGFNQMAVKCLENIQRVETPISISSFVIYRPSISTESREELVRLYRRGLTQLESELKYLAENVSEQSESVRELGMHLSTLGSQTIGDQEEEEYKLENLLANLWTKFGWNKDEVARYERNLKVFNEVGTHYRAASDMVRGILGEVQTLKSKLKMLRTSVYFEGEFKELEEHLVVFRKGVERLAEDKNSVRRLELTARTR